MLDKDWKVSKQSSFFSLLRSVTDMTWGQMEDYDTI